MSVLDRYHPAQKPTAQASFPDRADTALKSFTTAPGLGEGTMLHAVPTVQRSSGAIASIPWRVLSTTIDGDADSTLGLGTNAQVPAGPEDGGFDAPPAAVQVPWAVADGVPQSSLDCTVNRIA